MIITTACERPHRQAWKALWLSGHCHMKNQLQSQGLPWENAERTKSLSSQFIPLACLGGLGSNKMCENIFFNVFIYFFNLESGRQARTFPICWFTLPKGNKTICHLLFYLQTRIGRKQSLIWRKLRNLMRN